MQSQNIVKYLRIGLLIVYPAFAVLIWFTPLFNNVSQTNKIILSTLLGLYALMRITRIARSKPNQNNE